MVFEVIPNSFHALTMRFREFHQTVCFGIIKNYDNFADKEEGHEKDKHRTCRVIARRELSFADELYREFQSHKKRFKLE